MPTQLNNNLKNFQSKARTARLVLAVVLIALCWQKPVMAQSDSGWQINAFNSAIAIQSSGVVRVDEQISANFSEPKHGIYRDIPLAYQTHDSPQLLYTKIDVRSVMRNGQPEPYELQQNTTTLRIKIGDANKTFTGPQQYDIAYNATGVLSAFNQYDELYWNVTGNSWGVPISQASATVTLPKNGLIQFSCYQGVVGSVETCHTSPKSGSMAQFAASRALQPGEGLTVAVGYQKGMVPILTVAAPRQWWQELLQPGSVLSLVIAALVSLAAVGWLYLKKGRDWWWRNPEQLDPGQSAIRQPLGGHDSVVVEYTPPDNLPPGMLGLIKDEKADTLDVTATIIDLAARGYLVIKKLDKQWPLWSKDYQLTRTDKTGVGLWGYEKMLLERMLDVSHEVKLSALRDTFYRDLSEIKAEMYREAVAKGWFKTNPLSTRTGYLVAGIGLSIVAGGLAFVSISEGLFVIGSLLLGVVVGTVSLAIVSQWMSRRTAVGHELYRRTRGYRLFIATAEAYRQRFFEQQNLFTQVLPYAMMFGLTDKFAQAMKQIGFQPPAPTWYIGPGPFNLVAFSQDMGNVSKALSSSLASAPSGSGSGGGGFSGGGFGGGGGGSW